MTRSLDVLVVGAGQAGLAAGYWLRRTPLRFLLVDGAARIGYSWRRRWDSLTLFTPAVYSALPGLGLPGDPWRYPTKDEIADYLERYARWFDLPVQLGSGVVRLETGDRGFQARLATGERLMARTVIVATGAFQLPGVPSAAERLADHVVQLGPNSYRNPAATPDGTVLVVGDGATGRQIALDLAATHRVVLATGRTRRVTPDRVLGRSVFWWLERLGVLRASRRSRIGRYLMSTDGFPGRHLTLDALAASGVAVRPRLASLAGAEATFLDGRRERLTTVVWSTGYQDDTSWMAIDGVLDGDGRSLEMEGVSPVDGLYYVGRHWQRSRASALLLGVGDDARDVVAAVSRQFC